MADPTVSTEPYEWHRLYRSARQRLLAASMAALSAFVGMGLASVGVVVVVAAIQRNENVPLVSVPLLVPLALWASVRFWKTARVRFRAARAVPGRVELGVHSLTFEDASLFVGPLVIPRERIAKITLPPAIRNAMVFEESEKMKWIKLSLMAESPNCGDFLTEPVTAPVARDNAMDDPRGWGRMPGTAPPSKGEDFQVIWLRTADWVGARALRSWADSSIAPLDD